ncbi:ketosamine-3-kinase-like isoform X3 [Palaemon carinicauda]|uniref:ketosamine-3-kinase-like isoform X3 n=1 Tax=Palaemon carinicauda TaxID=392227 RepID=UPI0035B581C9
MTSKMYDAVRQALGTSRFVATGQVGGGCINEGEVDHGKDITVKTSNSRQARAMFDGEFKSPKATKLTGIVMVPTPHIVVDDPTGGAVLCLEYRDMAQFESAHGNAWEAAGRARGMFDGEFESPKATKATGTVMVPTPHIVVDDPAGRAVLCLEYPDMRSLNRPTGMLGKQLAEQ